jgi:mannosyltransferase OCH1-like enzyme
MESLGIQVKELSEINLDRKLYADFEEQIGNDYYSIVVLADYIRQELIYLEGGMYIDVDIEIKVYPSYLHRAVSFIGLSFAFPNEIYNG